MCCPSPSRKDQEHGRQPGVGVDAEAALILLAIAISGGMCTKLVLYVADGDSAAIISWPNKKLSCWERDTAVFTLRLSSEPTSDATVGVSTSDTTEGNLGDVSAITLTADSWATQQSVTATGVDDNTIDGDVSYYGYFYYIRYNVYV
jgi:hypothetical protein